MRSEAVADALSASTCRGRLPGGETCTLWVRFAPSSEGEEKRDATLVLDTNATPATYEVDLIGSAGKLPSGDPGQPGTTGPQGPKGDPGAGLASATISCRPAKVRRKRVRVKCTLKLAVGARVRAARVTLSRSGHVSRAAAGLASHGRVRIRLPRGVRSGRIRVVTIDRSGRLRVTRTKIRRG